MHLNCDLAYDLCIWVCIIYWGSLRFVSLMDIVFSSDEGWHHSTLHNLETLLVRLAVERMRRQMHIRRHD